MRKVGGTNWGNRFFWGVAVGGLWGVVAGACDSPKELNATGGA